MMTVRTADPREPFLEIAAFQIGADNIADHAAQETVFFCEPLFVINCKIDIMPLQHMPQGGVMRVSRAVYCRSVGVFQRLCQHEIEDQHNSCQNLCISTTSLING